ncbi:hypothetical protein ACGFIZ_06540, partial [Micromonospora sp. NPDC048830]
GGGIYAKDTVLHLKKVTVENNKASNDGGGIFDTATNKKKDDKDKDKSYNDEHGDDRDHNQRGSATIDDSAILGNNAGRRGGGIFNGDPNLIPGPVKDNDAIVTLRHSKVENNTAGNGGGIFNNRGTVRLIDTKVKKNTANDTNKPYDIAGGVVNNDGTVKVDDESIITDNDPRNCAGEVPGCFA